MEMVRGSESGKPKGGSGTPVPTDLTGPKTEFAGRRLCHDVTMSCFFEE